MSDEQEAPPADPFEEAPVDRCPECDSVLPADADHCLLCGAELTILPAAEERGDPEELLASSQELAQRESDNVGEPDLDFVESEMMERRSPVALLLTALFVILVAVVAALVLQNPIAAELAIVPTETPRPPTITYTPTWTPLPSETVPPSTTPTTTLTPVPTETPQPLRSHTVVSGETLFGLGLRYSVSPDSIAETNGLPSGSAIHVSQQLLIPWPTPTPPLVPVAIEIRGETIVADPTDCEQYSIQSGDTFFGLAARARIDLQALLVVNRLTEQSILQPGDVICIPKIIRTGVLPPTPGPSPTATPTLPPPGPHLLFPIRDAVVDPPDGVVVLQWSAVKHLTDSEWYMIELTDLTAVDSHPKRAFTRQTSFRIPEEWRPDEPEEHSMRWRVSIVQVTGRRQDGSFIYTFGGASSEDAIFTWLGAVPTATPQPSPTTEAVD